MFAGERLRQKREEIGLSQEELGKQIGATKVAISNYENKKDNPKFDKFERLTEILDVTPDYLMNRDISVVCEEEEVYHFKISNEELKLIQKLRRNKELAKEINEIIRNR